MKPVPAAVACISSTRLLCLPSVLLSDILSWSPDSATANALMTSCPALHALRRDPVTAALVLLRCRSTDYDAALASCAAASVGGVAPVVQQALQQLGGGEHSAAAPALLQALLSASAETGDAASVRALLALPRPPDVNGANSRALRAALKGEHQLGALHALLEAGALEGTFIPGWGSWAFTEAVHSAAAAAVLPLLVQFWPPQHLNDLLPGLRTGLQEALRESAAQGVPFLLTAIDAAGGGGDAAACAKRLATAAGRGCLPALTAVLDHSPPSPAALATALEGAVRFKRVECCRLLLHRGAVIGDAGVSLLALAMARLDAGIMLLVGVVLPPAAVADVAVYETVELLLEHGAIPTPALLAVAQRANVDGLVPLLQRAIAIAAGPL